LPAKDFFSVTENTR